MAINPPSDIVLDVARAADPMKLQAAALKLTGAVDGDDFTNVVDGMGSAESTKPATITTLPLPDLRVAVGAEGQQNSRMPALSDPSMKPYRDFEAFVLQSFVENMLPKESEDVFGKGTAGEMWKGLLAEQLGKQLARAGGIGIAAQIYKSHPGGLSGLAGRHAAIDPPFLPNGVAPLSWRQSPSPPPVDHQAVELAPHNGGATSDAAATVKRTL